MIRTPDGTPVLFETYQRFDSLSASGQRLLRALAPTLLAALAVLPEFELHQARGGSAWRVTVVQEGRVVWRGTLRAGRGSGSFSWRRRLRDYVGADAVSVRATGPSGAGCRASLTLPGA